MLSIMALSLPENKPSQMLQFRLLAEYRYGECRYADCCSALSKILNLKMLEGVGLLNPFVTNVQLIFS